MDWDLNIHDLMFQVRRTDLELTSEFWLGIYKTVVFSVFRNFFVTEFIDLSKKKLYIF